MAIVTVDRSLIPSDILKMNEMDMVNFFPELMNYLEKQQWTHIIDENTQVAKHLEKIAELKHDVDDLEEEKSSLHRDKYTLAEQIELIAMGVTAEFCKKRIKEQNDYIVDLDKRHQGGSQFEYEQRREAAYDRLNYFTAALKTLKPVEMD